MDPIRVAQRLVRDVEGLRFAAPVTHVYNPLVYAWRPHRIYLQRYADGSPQAILLGMNPGPWGMAQSGIPFGDVAMVRDWLGIDAKVDKPKNEHVKRPVDGFACTRSEVSGTRLWGWARQRFDTPKRFFARFFVANYCPLSFMEAGGRNRTPDKLPAREREPLFAACDRALVRLVEHMQPEWVIGIGAFAETRATAALDGVDVKIGRVLHPSPANPIANRGWAKRANADLKALGIGG